MKNYNTLKSLYAASILQLAKLAEQKTGKKFVSVIEINPTYSAKISNGINTITAKAYYGGFYLETKNTLKNGVESLSY